MLPVPGFRHQNLDVPSNQRLVGISKNDLRGAIGPDDCPFTVDRDHGIDRRVQDRLVELAGSMERGGALNDSLLQGPVELSQGGFGKLPPRDVDNSGPALPVRPGTGAIALHLHIEGRAVTTTHHQLTGVFPIPHENRLPMQVKRVLRFAVDKFRDLRADQIFAVHPE